MQNYDEIAAGFDNYVETSLTEWTFGYPQVIKRLSPLPGMKVLDFGCGAGNFSLHLQARGARVTGVDCSKEMISAAQRKSIKESGISTRRQCDHSPEFYWLQDKNIEDFHGENFDYAVLNFVLCTVSSQEQILEILRNVHACLKEGGHCIVLNTNWERANGCEFVSFKLEQINTLTSGCRIGLWLKTVNPIYLEDFYWSQGDYLNLFHNADFESSRIIEVPPAQTDMEKWMDESRVSPFYLVEGHKR